MSENLGFDSVNEGSGDGMIAGSGRFRFNSVGVVAVVVMTVVAGEGRCCWRLDQ